MQERAAPNSRRVRLGEGSPKRMSKGGLETARKRYPPMGLEGQAERRGREERRDQEEGSDQEQQLSLFRREGVGRNDHLESGLPKTSLTENAESWGTVMRRDGKRERGVLGCWKPMVTDSARGLWVGDVSECPGLNLHCFPRSSIYARRLLRASSSHTRLAL